MQLRAILSIQLPSNGPGNPESAEPTPLSHPASMTRRPARRWVESRMRGWPCSRCVIQFTRNVVLLRARRCPPTRWPTVQAEFQYWLMTAGRHGLLATSCSLCGLGSKLASPIAPHRNRPASAMATGLCSQPPPYRKSDHVARFEVGCIISSRYRPAGSCP
ncbi:hypothetical protein PYCCODRAFT_404814 [Trametes coccinea BRFM310]|uniref:Uncharacterized protein n=1 Tax=Trametes coccinea (strain BRFM310) TaxID=1353009 RepID=A0A1Y2IMX6_TRAC3|nr:hypothetical protein PYCCODRAFT_404814 [Trametes coccinea BRFM310]